ncbi:unnamed protein product [Angiostrongylus costaricensis]|uniref:BTB domain-containing protein n=1 Tax=Angiostrongylus costaricensis TaxID=334426 RepID=A0A0R3PG38_ANGCS|nr:unnamed protein product [Angiostrongylus costaricensis]
MLLDVKNRPRCDLNITAGFGNQRVVLSAHKCKLIAHSDVFCAMFRHNTKERETKSVMIEDFAASAVKSMLTFVYVGSISLQDLESREVGDVMRLADKYFIKALKAICEKELIARIRSSNVVDFVELADFCNATCLYEKCVHFVSENDELILINAGVTRCKLFQMGSNIHSTSSSVSWQALMDRNPRLTASIMDRMNDLANLVPL